MVQKQRREISKAKQKINTVGDNPALIQKPERASLSHNSAVPSITFVGWIWRATFTQKPAKFILVKMPMEQGVCVEWGLRQAHSTQPQVAPLGLMAIVSRPSPKKQVVDEDRRRQL